MIEENEAKITELTDETTKVEAEPVKEKTEKVKDLEKTMKDIEQKQVKEEQSLRKVEAALHEIIDEKPKEPPTDYGDKHVEKKPDTSEFKKNLAIIEKEEERKEEFIENRKAALEAIPKNPAVEAAEIAEEEAA